MSDCCSSSALSVNTGHKSENRRNTGETVGHVKNKTKVCPHSHRFPLPMPGLPLTSRSPSSAHPRVSFISWKPYWIQEKKLALVLAAFLVRMVELVLGPSRMLVLAAPLVPLLMPALQVALLLARLLFRMY